MQHIVRRTINYVLEVKAANTYNTY